MARIVWDEDELKERDAIVQSCVSDVLGAYYVISIIIEEIPDEINILAFQWGWFDTEVRDKIYVWLKNVLT